MACYFKPNCWTYWKDCRVFAFAASCSLFCKKMWHAVIINIAPAEFNEHVVGHALEWIKGHIANLTNLTTWIFLLRQERTVHKGSETFSHNYYIFSPATSFACFFIIHNISPSTCKVHNIRVLPGGNWLCSGLQIPFLGRAVGLGFCFLLNRLRASPSSQQVRKMWPHG